MLLVDVAEPVLAQVVGLLHLADKLVHVFNIDAAQKCPELAGGRTAFKERQEKPVCLPVRKEHFELSAAFPDCYEPSHKHHLFQ